VSAQHQQCERRARYDQGLVSGLVRCKGPPFSRMCARMRNHSTASPAPSASSAPAALIDIGVNLAHDSYDADRDAVLARAQAAGVVQMLITGSSLASTQRALALARLHPLRLFATAGVHPHHALELTAQRAAELEDLARQPEVVAVGECGLDYFRDLSPRDAQRQAFHRQLELAARVGKPVFLHQRDAHADFAAILREHGAHWRGVAHCFTGSGEELACYLQLGLAIGITGWICDERRGAHLAALMPQIPAERLLLETDAPYLLPRDLKPRPASRRNEPAYLPQVAATVARARGESLETLARSSSAAARALFGLPEPCGAVA
jgi:TatD DNase family protein